MKIRARPAVYVSLNPASGRDSKRSKPRFISTIRNDDRQDRPSKTVHIVPDSAEDALGKDHASRAGGDPNTVDTGDRQRRSPTRISSKPFASSAGKRAVVLQDAPETIKTFGVQE